MVPLNTLQAFLIFHLCQLIVLPLAEMEQWPKIRNRNIMKHYEPFQFIAQ